LGNNTKGDNSIYGFPKTMRPENMNHTEHIDRRKFFKTWARYLSFGTITFTGAKLMTKKPKLENQVCINKSMCKDCQSYAKCELPRALSMKLFKKKLKNG